MIGLLSDDWQPDYLPEGARYDKVKADRAVSFISLLPHTKGKFARSPFVLEDWQEEIVRQIFGVLRENGARQYRVCFVEIPRKNGKSELGAAVALYLLLSDGEESAEIYGAAYDRTQAALVFDVALRMCNLEKTGRLAKATKRIPSTKRIIEPTTNSFYTAIPSDEEGSHGFNASGIIFDEVHTQKNDKLWEVLQNSVGTREQPLTFAITTAGHDRLSLCYELHEHAVGLLKLRFPGKYDHFTGISTALIDDPNFFAAVWAAPEDADWEDEAVWHACNPGLGTFRSLDDMRDKARRAKAIPRAENAFRNQYLNQWTSSETRWLDLGVWDAAVSDYQPARGQGCYAAVDLAQTSDLASLALVFPLPDGKYHVKHWYWIASRNLEERERRDRVPYRQWVKEGRLIVSTANDIIDYDQIESHIYSVADEFKIVELAYDPWSAHQMAQHLDKSDLEIFAMRQGFQAMSPASKEFERLTREEKITHIADPILRWMLDNTVVVTDDNGNIRPSRKKSTQKIDGVVATIMALDRAMSHTETASVYSTRGIRTL